MKISTSQLYDSAITQMNRQQSNVAEMQAKLAAGKSLVKPSDDAEKATLIQRLNSAAAALGETGDQGKQGRFEFVRENAEDAKASPLQTL